MTAAPAPNLRVVGASEDLPQLLASFKLHLRAEGRSPRTVETYTESAQAFMDHLAAEGAPLARDTFTADSVRSWLAALRESGKAPATISIRHRGLRAWARWLVAEGELANDPFANVSAPKVEPEKAPVLEIENVRAMLATCDNS